jgi:PD-(D/E)XK nuclease superfamily
LGDYLHQSSSAASVTAYDIELAFQTNEINEVIIILTKMFKILPYSFFLEDVERKDKKGNVTIVQRQVSENFYHAIIYLIFNILAIRMQVEILASNGRIDATVKTNTHVYLFEFKKGRKPKDAIQQMWDHQYANLFSLSKKQIVYIGVCFTAQKRGISGSAIVNSEAVEAYLAAV